MSESKRWTYLGISHEKLRCFRFAEREFVWDFGAALGLAQMPVSNSGKTDRIGGRRLDETLEFLDESDGCGIDRWTCAGALLQLDWRSEDRWQDCQADDGGFEKHLE